MTVYVVCWCCTKNNVMGCADGLEHPVAWMTNPNTGFVLSSHMFNCARSSSYLLARVTVQDGMLPLTEAWKHTHALGLCTFINISLEWLYIPLKLRPMCNHNFQCNLWSIKQLDFWQRSPLGGPTTDSRYRSVEQVRFLKMNSHEGATMDPWNRANNAYIHTLYV